MDSEYLASVVERARQRQYAIESQRQRDGGIFDPLLQRFVTTAETERRNA